MLSSLLVLFPLALAPNGGSGPVTYADDTFADADWQTSTILVGPGSVVGTGVQVQAGNPAPARRASHAFGPSGVFTTIWLFHAMVPAVHDPAVDGPIGQLSFSIDYLPGNLQRVYALVQQGSRSYVNLSVDWLTTGSTWQTFGPTVHDADDFVEQLPDGSYDPASHPDFSAAGAPITFGFTTGNTSGGPNTLSVDYDNFQVVVNGVPSTAIVRLGTPPNPDAFRPGAAGPVVGTTWSPFIDHASFLPGATMDFAVYSRSPGSFATNYGTFLCSQPEDGLMVPAGQPFAFVIPDNLLLAGQTYCFQGASVDPLQGVQLTNALDVTFGTL